MATNITRINYWEQSCPGEITIVTNYDSTSHSAAMRGLPLPVTDTNIVGSEKKVYNDVESNTLQWQVVS